MSLVIGMVACGTSACPDPSKDLGEVLFIGKYEPQGGFGNLEVFENFTLSVPSDISGSASIQVQHSILTTTAVSTSPIIFCIELTTMLGRDIRNLPSVTSVPQSKLDLAVAVPLLLAV